MGRNMFDMLHILYMCERTLHLLSYLALPMPDISMTEKILIFCTRLSSISECSLNRFASHMSTIK